MERGLRAVKYLLFKGKELVGEAVKLGDRYSVVMFEQLRLTRYMTEAELKAKRIRLVKE